MPSTLFQDIYLTCQTCHQRFLHTRLKKALESDCDLPTECPGCRALRQLTQRQTGKVVWYNRRRGFGFVRSKDASLVFVHISDLGRHLAAKLHKGALLRYRVEPTERGLRAIEIEILSKESASNL